MTTDKKTEREKAVDAQFVMASSDELADPARRAELEAEALASGKLLVLRPKPSHYAKKLEDAAARSDVPTIQAGDSRAFLDNLGKVAAGKVRLAPKAD